MNKHLITIIMVVAATFSLAATDLFRAEDFTIRPGESAQIRFVLENETEYTAFQTDMYLPDGLEVDLQSVALTSRKGSDHRIATSVLPDGGIRLMSYSMGVKPYSGNNGALVTLQVTASDEMTLPSTLMLKNVLFTCVSGVEITLPESECSIYLRGDVNCDGNITIGDVTLLINQLLSYDEYPVQSDVNGDSNVNINDVTTLINYLLTSN